MSANVSVITTNTKDSIVGVVDAVNGNVLAHINGDFGAHNKVRVLSTPYRTPNNVEIVAPATLRMEIFNQNTGQTVVIAIPCFLEGTSVSGGPPVILIQPEAAISAPLNSTQQFSVAIASQATATYLWQKLVGPGFQGLTAQKTRIIVFSHIKGSDAGAYRVVVSNAYGSTISSVGSLTVS